MRILFFILILINYSCSKRATISYKDYLKDKTYLQVNENSEGYSFFDPCDSKIFKYKFNNTLYIDYGQDNLEYSEWNIKRINNDSVYIEVYEKPIWKELLKLKLDTTNHLIYNQDFIFIDSLKSTGIPYIKEPCENCWDKEICERLTKQEIKIFHAEWKSDCTKDFQGIIGLSPISEFYMDFIFPDHSRARIITEVAKSLKNEKLYNLKYDMLTSITRYNENLEWQNFSRDSIIAHISLKSSSELEFTWNGFYNTKTKQWESKDYVFASNYENPITLNKCEK